MKASVGLGYTQTLLLDNPDKSQDNPEVSGQVGKYIPAATCYMYTVQAGHICSVLHWFGFLQNYSWGLDLPRIASKVWSASGQMAHNSKSPTILALVSKCDL